MAASSADLLEPAALRPAEGLAEEEEEEADVAMIVGITPNASAAGTAVSSDSDAAPCPLPLRPCASASTASTATSPVPPAWLEAKADLPFPPAGSGIRPQALLEHEVGAGDDRWW